MRTVQFFFVFHVIKNILTPRYRWEYELLPDNCINSNHEFVQTVLCLVGRWHSKVNRLHCQRAEICVWFHRRQNFPFEKLWHLNTFFWQRQIIVGARSSYPPPRRRKRRTRSFQALNRTRKKYDLFAGNFSPVLTHFGEAIVPTLFSQIFPQACFC